MVEDERMARMEVHMENIIARLECLPGLTTHVDDHERRLSTIESASRWLVGILSAVITGTLVIMAKGWFAISK